MNRLTTVVLALAVSATIHAQSAREEWNWYYVAFHSQAPGASVLLRSGTASVEVSENRIHVQFADREQPELRASFEGRIVDTVSVTGTLTGLFPSGAESRVGTYRRVGTTDKCRWQEIALRPSVPDGSVLMLSRVDGICQ